jgi:hypothetical protein
LDFEYFASMENNKLKKCAIVSGIWLAGFLCLYAYVWIVDPNPSKNGNAPLWTSISIGHNSSSYPTNITGTFVFDGGNTLHISATKLWGGNLVFFNQAMPYTGGVIGFSGDTKNRVTGVNGFGVYFRHIVDPTNQSKNWWTLMVNIWYPIIAFGILPAIFLVKQIRGVTHKHDIETGKFQKN